MSTILRACSVLAVVFVCGCGASDNPLPPVVAPPGPTPPPTVAPAPTGRPIDVSLLPPGPLTIAIRPAVLCANPVLNDLLTKADPDVASAFWQYTVLPPAEIDSLVWVFPFQKMLRPELPPYALQITARQPVDWERLAAQALPGVVRCSRTGEQTPPPDRNGSGGSWGYLAVDPQTLILIPVAALPDLVERLQRRRQPPEWDEEWRQRHWAQVLVHFDLVLARDEQAELQRNAAADGKPVPQLSASGQQLLANLAGASLAMEVVGPLSATVLVTRPARQPNVPQLSDSDLMQALAATRQEVLLLFEKTFQQRHMPLPKPLSTEPVETSSSTPADGSAVQLQLGYSWQRALPVELKAVVEQSCERRRRWGERMGLQQIALALHAYNEAHRKLPTSANAWPDSPHRVSWRVLLLPYLEEQALFDTYHFAEPWDSKHNQTLLAKMPAVFRHPLAPAETTSSSYYLLTGPTTAFPDTPRSLDAIQKADGQAQTLLVVESQRDIPWTKPEDLPYDPSQPLPKLGGYTKGAILAAFGDGVVRHVKPDTSEKTWRAIISVAGKEPIEERELTD